MPRAFRFSMLAAAALALVTTACSTERSLESMYGEDMRPEGVERVGLNGLTEGARLLGDIGPVEDLDHDAEVSEWNDGWQDDRGSDYRYDTIQLDVYDGSKWAMIQLAIEGGVDHPSLQPGNSLTFSNYGYYEGQTAGDDELYVSAIGCSSDDDVDMDSWVDEGGDYFDEPADEVIIDVYEGETDDTKILDVRTSFPSTSQQAEAGIVVPNRG